MTEQRTQQSSSRQQLVLLAEALLAAQSAEELAERIAEILSVPLALARRVAALAILDVPEVTDDGFIGAVQEENLIYRAAYIRAAAGRLSRAGEAGAEGPTPPERHYYSLHRHQETRRLEGGERVAEAISLYGDVLGWYAQIRPTNRPNHRAAHHHNFRPLMGIPALTLAYPGVLPNCLCEVGPPLEGAAEIH